VQVNDMETVGRLHAHQREVRGWDLGQKSKMSVHHSVSGMLHETAMWGNTGRWHGCRLIAWVLLHIHQCEAGERGLGQKFETKCLQFSFGHAM
jgi:hypothetical protein